jgi:hypothetical protein
MDSKGEDKDNLHFLQALRQAKALASQVVVEFASLIIPSTLKRCLSKSKRKKQRSNFMAHQTRYVLSPKPERLIFTPIEKTYVQELERITTQVSMGEDEK